MTYFSRCNAITHDRTGVILTPLGFLLYRFVRKVCLESKEKRTKDKVVLSFCPDLESSAIL